MVDICGNQVHVCQLQQAAGIAFMALLIIALLIVLIVELVRRLGQQ